tara:strand:- start:187 stop:357 length:171 start_codon:yes stop_codon:yes gene_type:complete
MFRTKKNKKFNYKPKYVEEKKSKRIYFKQKNIPKSKNTVIIFLIMLFLFLSLLFFS